MLPRSLALLFVAFFLAGCSRPKDGGNPHNLPISGLNYSSRHTYPLVAKAVIRAEAKQPKPTEQVLHAWDFSQGGDLGLEKVVREKCDDGPLTFVPFAQAQEQEGRFVDNASGRPVYVWTISVRGGKRGTLTHRVDIRTSAAETRSYKVILKGSVESDGWSVGQAKPW